MPASNTEQPQREADSTTSCKAKEGEGAFCIMTCLHLQLQPVAELCVQVSQTH